MKKLFLSLAVVMSVSLFSCGGNGAEGAAADSVAADSTVAVDTCCGADTCADTCATVDTTVVVDSVKA